MREKQKAEGSHWHLQCRILCMQKVVANKSCVWLPGDNPCSSRKASQLLWYLDLSEDNSGPYIFFSRWVKL